MWVSSLSASEVEELLGSPTVHHQRNYQRYYQNPTIKGQHWRNTCHSGHTAVDHKECCVNHLLSNDVTGAGFHSRVNWYDGVQKENHWGHQGNADSRQEKRFDHSTLKHNMCSLYKMRKCQGFQESHPFSHASTNINYRNSSRYEGHSSACCPPQTCDQDMVSAYQRQICYTTASDNNGVDEGNLYSPTSGQSGLYIDPDSCERRPSPIYGDDSPYTILNTMDSGEPITAIFMGFQRVQDDSGLGQEFDETLKPELVFIEDDPENGENNSTEEKKTEPIDVEEFGERQRETVMEPDTKNIQGKFNFLTMCFSCQNH